MLTSFAPAKVNLFLHVTGKREDGYHLLDSLAVFPAAGDRLSLAPDGAGTASPDGAGSASPDRAVTLGISGRFGDSLSAEPDNLVLRAARLLASKAGVPAAAALHLEKNLPVASGIGGGSADAAAALRLLARHWRLTLPLHDIALSLGADVPVCLDSLPARMRGVGEILSPAPKLPEFGILLVNPGVQVATADVFRARTGGYSPAATLPEVWRDAAAMAATLAALDNDLEAPAIALAPRIATVLETMRGLPGVLLARMSGSGATCFALFATPAQAAAAAARIERPGWWRWGGGLYEPGLADL
jgi:4-diphosphocytidyl-2-C-methyl-D-erythritol kinase